MEIFLFLLQPIVFIAITVFVFLLFTGFFGRKGGDGRERRTRNGEIYTEAREVKRPENEEVQDLDKNK